MQVNNLIINRKLIVLDYYWMVCMMNSIAEEGIKCEVSDLDSSIEPEPDTYAFEQCPSILQTKKELLNHQKNKHSDKYICICKEYD